MKFKILILLLITLFLSGCIGVSSKGIFGTGVSVALDPRSLGTQIDDSIMQKNLSARILLLDKKSSKWIPFSISLIFTLIFTFISCASLPLSLS